MHCVNFFAPILPRKLKRKPRNPRRRLLRNNLQALDHARHHGVFQSRIQILGVFADQNQIDAQKPRLHAFQVLHRPHIGVQVERLAQRHVNARRPAHHGSRQRPFQRHLVFANRFQHAGLHEIEAPPFDLRPRGDLVPRNVHSSCTDDFLNRCGNFRANPVAGNQRYGVFHRRQLF